MIYNCGNYEYLDYIGYYGGMMMITLAMVTLMLVINTFRGFSSHLCGYPHHHHLCISTGSQRASVTFQKEKNMFFCQACSFGGNERRADIFGTNVFGWKKRKERKSLTGKAVPRRRRRRRRQRRNPMTECWRRSSIIIKTILPTRRCFLQARRGGTNSNLWQEKS